MWSSLRRVRCLLAIIILSLAWAVQARAQAVRFIQITDPHLFDQGDEAENKSALAACIRKINDQIGESGEYQFAVITGDIGIENLVSIGKNAAKDNVVEPDKAKREKRIEQGARDLASILAQSRIRVWLILPGNNDLLNEEPDLQYYRLFIQFVQSKLPGMQIIDLCPEDPANDKLQFGTYRLGALAFVGFNNASFKNNNKSERISRNKSLQLAYVKQVMDRIGAADISRAYIFYHIPETDDPYLITDEDQDTLTERKKYKDNLYLYSSWFVDKDVHELWQQKVVRQDKVRGLFAGHYHDSKRNTYSSYHWLVSDDYLSGSLSKLYISPPLAAKRQPDSSSQARGFQEVTIDGEGHIAARIFWLNTADKTFDYENGKEEKEALQQLRLGEVYERSGEFKEADDAYNKALNSKSSVTRARAYDGLDRTTHMQMSFWNKYFFTRVGRSLTFTETWVLTVVLLVTALLIVVWLIVRARRSKLGLEPFADSTKDKHAATFQEILKFRLDGLRQGQQSAVQQRLLGRLPLYTTTRGKPPALIDVPTLWESSVFVDLASKTLPGAYGVFAATFLQIFDKPDYLIQGAFQSQDDSAIYAIVTLKRRGKLLRVWEQELAAPALAAQQRELANGIVTFLREFLINESANEYK